jgi:hypothetical protein
LTKSENESWNPLEMYKKKERLQRKQKEMTDSKYGCQVPVYPNGLISPPRPKSVAAANTPLPKILK